LELRELLIHQSNTEFRQFGRIGKAPVTFPGGNCGTIVPRAGFMASEPLKPNKAHFATCIDCPAVWFLNETGQFCCIMSRLRLNLRRLVLEPPLIWKLLERMS